MRRFLVVVTITILTLPVIAHSQSNEESIKKIEEMLNKLRNAAIENNDRASIASFLLDDYAEASAYLSKCSGSGDPDFEDISKRYAEWAAPGIMAGLNGERGRKADQELSSMNLKYSVGKLTAECRSPMIHAQRLIVDTSLSEFDAMLAEPVEP